MQSMHRKKPKDPVAVARGAKGGKKGGPVRASHLTPEERSDQARQAAMARWHKKKKKRNRIRTAREAH